MKNTKSDTTTAAKAPAPAKAASKGKLGQILGHSVVSVIRALGKAGWELDEAQDTLQHLRISAKPHTIKMGLKRGRDGDKTRKIAPLTTKQLNSLRVAKPAAKDTAAATTTTK
jgi:hypothetical protein